MTPPVLLRALLLVVLVGSTLAVPAAAARGQAPRLPVVAVLDTGLRATHQEFDYRGAASTTDQLVGWWDFSSARGTPRNPRPGQTWDDRTPDPYDDHGHGTAVASMAVGRNRTADKSRSAAPGHRLAVGKVLGATLDGDLAAAIRWATTTVRADVLSISIASIAPVPAAVYADVYDALEEARRAGVTVVVGGGNGWANLGVVPLEPGWATSFSNSPAALSVGAAAEQGLLYTTDPEVVADHAPVAAAHTADDAYAHVAGTSFAAPLVAGLASRVVAATRSSGRAVVPERVEQLLQAVARDTEVPPQWEGWGEVGLAQLPALLRHANAGTLPEPGADEVTTAYMTQVRGPLAEAWTRWTSTALPAGASRRPRR